MRILAIIPARGGSKGIPRKNIKIFGGKPLIEWSISAAMGTDIVDRIIVSTEDEEIAELARKLGADVPFLRSQELAGDEVPGIAPVLDVLERFPQYDWVLLLQPTSPLRSTHDIEGIVHFCIESGASSAVSVCEVTEHPLWMYQKDESGRLHPFVVNTRHEEKRDRRQDLCPLYILNGALYFANVAWLLEHKRFVGLDTLGYVMPHERSIDIDSAIDWAQAERLISYENGRLEVGHTS